MRFLALAAATVLILQGIALSLGDPPAPPSQDDPAICFMLANTMWTLVHEMGHALIAELDVPLVDKEEDAADRIATIALLHGSADHDIPNRIDEIEFIVAAAQAWRVEWELERLDQVTAPYWDSHALDIQRFYNIVCLLYGSDSDTYAGLAEQLALPAQRALECVDYEHEQARDAVTRMIRAHGALPEGVSRRGRISVVYDEPLNPERQPLVATLKRSGVAALVAGQTERLAVLPRDIKITFCGCFGDETAFWLDDKKEIVFSYDLMERFLYLYRAESLPGRSDAARSGARCLSRKTPPLKDRAQKSRCPRFRYRLSMRSDRISQSRPASSSAPANRILLPDATSDECSAPLMPGWLLDLHNIVQ